MTWVEKEVLIMITTLEINTFVSNNLKTRWITFFPVETFNTLRCDLKANYDWKINFRELHEETYAALI